MGMWNLSQKQAVTLAIFLLIAGSSIIIRSDYIRGGGRLILAYDPYYHYRMAETIVEEGHRPEWDYLASWPTGQPGDKHPPLYHYFLAYTYKAVGKFIADDVLTWCVYACIIPVILAVILAFAAGRELTNTAGGLFSAFLVAISAGTVGRTLIGYADTEGFILVFSLLITFFWVKSISNSRKYLYSALTGFSVFLFELTWRGYWYMLFLVIGASALYVLIHFFTKKEIDFTQITVLLLAFFIPHSFYSHFVVEGLILTGMAVLFFFTFRFKKEKVVALFIIVGCVYFFLSEGLIRSPFQEDAEPFVVRQGVFYPDVAPFISQRQDVTASRLLETFTVTLFLAPVGLYILLQKRDEKSYTLFACLVLFFAGTTLMIFQGTRYLLQLSVPMLLSSSIVLSHVWGKLAKDPRRAVVVFFGVAILLAPVYITAERVNKVNNPIEDGWFEALQWIEKNTPEDSVVISSWENGYWVESVARRKSIMNGGHYQLYWRSLKFGKMMQTADEEMAVKEVFGIPGSEVEEFRNFPEGDVGSALKEKEMTPFALEGQDAYVIIGWRTALTFHIISQFGTWDYTTGERESIQLYGGTPVGTVLEPHWKQYVFNTEEFPVVVYEADKEFHSYIMKGNSILPTEGTVYTDGETYFLKREKGTYGLVWYYSDTVMLYVPSDAVDTMMVRLFVFNGDGLNYFELVADFGTVKVYKIHRESQENLNEGVVVKEDEWRPY